MNISDEEIYRQIDNIIEPNSKKNIKEVIIGKSKSLKEISEKMWSEVMKILD